MKSTITIQGLEIKIYLEPETDLERDVVRTMGPAYSGRRTEGAIVLTHATIVGSPSVVSEEEPQ